MKNKIIILLNVIIILMVSYLIYLNKYRPEDVNKDGRINSLDLLIVQKKILSEMEGENDGKN